MSTESKQEKLGYEVRTLMYSVLGMVDLAVQRTEDAETKEYLCTAIQAAKSAMKKINEFVGSSEPQVKNPALDPTMSPPTPEVAQKLTEEKPRRLHILVAEDNPINQKIVYKFLTKHDHTVVVVDNGRKALEQIAQKEFDLVIMDVEMPEMDGREAVSLIREREQDTGRHLPIVALTAIDSHSENGWTEMLDAFIPKPFSPTKFYEVIAQLVNQPPSK